MNDPMPLDEMRETIRGFAESVRERIPDASAANGERARLKILAGKLEALAELKVLSNLIDGGHPGAVHVDYPGRGSP